MAAAKKKILTAEEKLERNRKRLDNYDPVAAARNAWRREFSRSPHVINLMNDPATKRHVPAFKKDGSRAKVDAVEHFCGVCKQWKRSRKGSKVAIDHVDPVVDPQVGFVDFNTYFARMWCSLTNLQKICSVCHQIKTNNEWFVRRFKEEKQIIEGLEALVAQSTCMSFPKEELRKGLRRFTPKKLREVPYPKEFVRRVEKLKLLVKKS